MNAIEKRIANTPVVEPDAEDLAAIKRIEQANDTSDGVTIGDIESLRAEQEYTGKISLRVPKMLHKELSQDAKKNGVSLNQFIVYKLAR